MKSISPTVYESLTPRQRIIATIEAEARDDQDEVQRLVKTCPKKTYRMNDADYAEEVQLLLADSMAMECDMSYMAINFLFVSLIFKIGQKLLLAAPRFQITQGEFRGVVKGLSRSAAQGGALLCNASLVQHGFLFKNGFFGRLQHRIHAADNAHGQDHIRVFSPLEQIAQNIICNTPNK